MTFNPLKEKGIALDKQVRTWHDIVKRPFNKNEVDCYSRTRQIFLNGIEVEAWGYKHNMARICPEIDVVKNLAQIRKIEDTQQTTVNWLTPYDQSVLETTLGYEQVAIDLTAWLAQNEPDEYVKECFDFGLLEDFDHLYRYAQWAHMIDGVNPDKILQGMTDVIVGRPTQYHHNENYTRIRKHYDKNTASPQTKVNILTLVSAEQQTHNFYSEHGMQYGSDALRKTYAEICDVEEEHVTMYESLIDPTESMYEKLLIHEFTEVCNYYNCMKDEPNEKLKMIWEEFLAFEIEHLKYAAELVQKYDKKDAEEIIGTKIIEPCHFTSQKLYVTKILESQIDKRLCGTNEMNYLKIKELPKNWVNFDLQNCVNADGAPSEQTMQVMVEAEGRHITIAGDKLKKTEPELLEKGLQDNRSDDTLSPEKMQNLIDTECEVLSREIN